MYKDGKKPKHEFFACKCVVESYYTTTEILIRQKYLKRDSLIVVELLTF